MTPGDVPALHLDADLHVEVDGVQAHLRGSGDRLVLATDHPVRLARAMSRQPGSPRSLLRLMRIGDAAGVTVSVEGRHGSLVRQARLAAAGVVATAAVVFVLGRARRA